MEAILQGLERHVAGASMAADGDPDAMPICGGLLSASIRALDLLQRWGGQRIEYGDFTLHVPPRIDWHAQVTTDDAELRIQFRGDLPAVTFVKGRFFRGTVEIAGVRLGLRGATLLLRRFPDFSIEFAW